MTSLPAEVPAGPRQRRVGPVLVGLVVALVLALVASGCGVPVDDPVEELSQDGREELLRGTTSTSTTILPEDDAFRVGLYFILGPEDKLQRIIRPYPESPLVDTVLNDLEQGPTVEEAARYQDIGALRSLLPAMLNARLDGKDLDRGVQFIRVDPEAGLRERLETEPGVGRLMVAQLVCTVLGSIEGVSGVEIFDGGESPLRVNDSALQPLDGPAQISDFDDCASATDELEVAPEETTTGSTSSTATTRSTTTTVNPDGSG